MCHAGRVGEGAVVPIAQALSIIAQQWLSL